MPKSRNGIPHPVHAYTAEGAYNVCLAVSNLRGVDTLCREVQVIINATNEAGTGISARISPNPVGASESGCRNGQCPENKGHEAEPQLQQIVVWEGKIIKH